MGIDFLPLEGDIVKFEEFSVHSDVLWSGSAQIDDIHFRYILSRSFVSRKM